MKTFLAAALATSMLSGAAHAADLVPVDIPENYSTFVAVKGGYGPSIIDNEFESTQGTGTNGEFDDDYIFGGSLEAGVFLTDRVRLSVEANYGRIEHDRQVINGRAFRLDGGTNLFQGFVKAAYELPLADIGFTAPLFERSSLVALGGVGFTHINSGGRLRNFPGAAIDPRLGGTLLTGVQEEEDTVFSAKVGLGTVYRLTDRIDLVSETSYIFGSDAELTSRFTLPNGVVAVSRSDVETQAVISQFGIRFRF